MAERGEEFGISFWRGGQGGSGTSERGGRGSREKGEARRRRRERYDIYHDSLDSLDVYNLLIFLLIVSSRSSDHMFSFIVHSYGLNVVISFIFLVCFESNEALF